MRDRLLRLLGFLAASSSIGILLAQFYGIASMRTLSWSVFCPICAVLAVLGLTPTRLTGGEDFRRRLLVGLWAGWWGTVAYDLWRAPFFLLGMKPFRAHPRFGEFLTGLAPDTAWAQAAGWLYHFSNRIAFGVMYAMAVR